MRSDAALAERFAAGDEAAFDVLYERHRPVVLAVSMGVLGTTADAEDATQETFSALAVALRTKPPAELRPWLIRVARNASIDTTRRRRHRLLTLDGEIPEIPARSTSAGQAELAVVLDGIRELPEGQRMALLMRELGGHSYSEIAEFLETDEEAVKGLIARARVGLRTYREATEMPCASARSTIAAEPDGRRYDKTVRRHLRTCASCRSYRAALRDDAKALRAALPLPAGGVATGGLSSGGMLTAAKGTLIGYGLTQAATTCAASACAVGAIGGMVFITPVHKLGLPPILSAPKVAPATHNHAAAAKKLGKHSTVVTVHQSAATEVPVTSETHVAGKPATVAKHSSAAKTVAHSAKHTSHRHRITVTKVKLPPLHVHTTATVTAPPAVTPVVSTPPASVPTTTTAASTVTPPATSTTQSTGSTGGSTQTGQGQNNGSGNDNGYGWSGRGGTNGYGQAGGSGRGNPVTTSSRGAGSTSTGTTTTSSVTSTGTTTTGTTTTGTTTGTTGTPTTTTPGSSGSHGYGSGYGGWRNDGGPSRNVWSYQSNWENQTTNSAATSATTSTTSTTQTSSTSQQSSWNGYDYGWGGHGGWGH
jgi:RNA polymerase sigma factor (sigma-70 family)